MSRKLVSFLIGGVTLATIMLSPAAARAADDRLRTPQSARQVLAAEVNEGGSEGRMGMTVAVTGPQTYSVGGLKGLVNCPEGSHLSAFEKPIYDEDGLFVIGYETVWFCIPDDLEPAG
jgi:hypothetical protein